jgi:hypothetical protein
LVALSTSRAVVEYNRLALIETLRVGGMFAMRQERWQDAESSLGEALSLAQAMQCPYHEARVRYSFGLLEADRAAAERAAEQLIAARTILDTLGERLYRDHVERALARLGSS